MSPTLEAIVLAGGRSTRFGADKAAATIDEETLLQRVVDAARAAGARRVNVVGDVRPLRPDPRVTWRRESPVFSGPAAAIATGVKAVTAEEVFVLACDLRHPARVVAMLERWRDHVGATRLRDLAETLGLLTELTDPAP